MHVTKSLSNVKQNKSADESDLSNDHDKILCKSLEHVSSKTATGILVLVARKDAAYQGSLHHIPLYNENIDESHRQMITTSNTKTAQSGVSADKKIKMGSKYSFIYELGKQIELKLLKDIVFALVAK
jgi:hypothetical protein